MAGDIVLYVEGLDLMLRICESPFQDTGERGIPQPLTGPCHLDGDPLLQAQSTGQEGGLLWELFNQGRDHLCPQMALEPLHPCSSFRATGKGHSLLLPFSE